jgi:hypothetical protein
MANGRDRMLEHTPGPVRTGSTGPGTVYKPSGPAPSTAIPGAASRPAPSEHSTALDAVTSDLVGSHTASAGVGGTRGSGSVAGTAHASGNVGASIDRTVSGSVADRASARGDADAERHLLPGANPSMPTRAERSPEEIARARTAALEEADRGLERQASGGNVVGISDDPTWMGETGSIAPRLFGDNPDAQRFGRLHDVQAAIAGAEDPREEDGLRYDIANGTSGVVGLLTTLASNPDDGAAVASGVFGAFGYETDDYETLQREAVMRSQTRDHTSK